MSSKGKDKILESIADILTPDNVQKYILGTKRNNSPRAIYDVVKDCIKLKKKKVKGKPNKNKNAYSLYIKRKNKKKKSKYWHI